MDAEIGDIFTFLYNGTDWLQTAGFDNSTLHAEASETAGNANTVFFEKITRFDASSGLIINSTNPGVTFFQILSGAASLSSNDATAIGSVGVTGTSLGDVAFCTISEATTNDILSINSTTITAANLVAVEILDTDTGANDASDVVNCIVFDITP